MTEPGRIKLHSVILCEDIREETRGRYSFMGIFRPTVWKIPAFPRRFYVGAALRFMAEQPGPVSIHVIFEGDPLETSLMAQGAVYIKYLDAESQYELDQSVIGNLILKIVRPGRIFVRFRQNDDIEWTTLGAIRFKHDVQIQTRTIEPAT